jgi:TonB family protein
MTDELDGRTYGMSLSTWLRLFSYLIPISILAIARSVSAQLPQTKLPEDPCVQLEACADRIANHIRSVKTEPLRPLVMVLDFSNHNGYKRSILGVAFADRLAESLGSRGAGFQVLDREDIHRYLRKHWLDDEELRNSEVANWLADQLHAAATVQASLEILPDGQLKVLIKVFGLGPAWFTEGRIGLTEDMRSMFEETAPGLERPPDEIGPEPGVFGLHDEGVSMPASACIYCPAPEYTDLARKAKYSGTVKLSAVLGVDGRLSAIKVVKFAPFDLTQQSIEMVLNWKFKPCQKDGKPVPVRMPVETTFRLY